MVNKVKRLLYEESGQTMVLAALLLVALLGFGAIAVDAGYMTVQKNNLQKAADAGALAGASIFLGHTQAEVEAEAESIAEANLNKTAEISISEYDAVNKTVEITITQQTPKFIAGVINSNQNSITVTAKAKNNVWAGESLPLINLAENYSIGSNIGVWSKEEPGVFESINKNLGAGDLQWVWHDEADQPYFEFPGYQDASFSIEIATGLKNDVANNIQLLYDQGMRYAYIWSMSNSSVDYYQELGLKKAFGNNMKIGSYDDGDVTEELVLLKVEILGYDTKVSKDDPRLTLKIVDEYEIFNNEQPDYADAGHNSRAFLID